MFALLTLLDTDEILAKLKLLQGKKMFLFPLILLGDKQAIINEITMEAKRLKKQQLITLLESFVS